jgi:hypothetical protein
MIYVVRPLVMTDDRQTAREPGAQDATSSAGIQCNKPGGGGMQTAESWLATSRHDKRAGMGNGRIDSSNIRGMRPMKRQGKRSIQGWTTAHSRYSGAMPASLGTQRSSQRRRRQPRDRERTKPCPALPCQPASCCSRRRRMDASHAHYCAAVCRLRAHAFVQGAE